MRMIPEERAERIVRLLASHEFARARRRLARPVRRALPARALAAAWEQHVDAWGDAPSVGPARLVDPPPAARVEVPLALGERRLGVSVHVDSAGRCTDVQVRPALEEWVAPGYVDRTAFSEEQLVLPTEHGAVGATLTVPRSDTPVPVAILLMGGGPFDRDGTAGPNRIGRDLGEGLASAGVAVLRFDKPSFRDPTLRSNPAFAPSWDYVPAVAGAVAQLSERTDVGEMWLVGHSMGGRYAPRVAAAVPAISGLVLLAADAAPLQRSAVRVARHLASLSGAPGEPGAAIAALEAAVARAESPRLSLRTPRSALPLGLTPGAWLELRDDDPVATAASMDLPMLLLQGGRDYQVSEADDLSLWRSGLDGRAVVRVLPQCDHYFFPGADPATPESLDAPQHVAPEVVATVAGFVTSTPRPAR